MIPAPLTREDPPGLTRIDGAIAVETEVTEGHPARVEEACHVVIVREEQLGGVAERDVVSQ